MVRYGHMLLVVALVVCSAGIVSAEDFAWIEGEKFSSTNYDVRIGGWGNPQHMSGGSWAHLSQQDKKNWPDGGFRLTYDFEVPSAGTYELWGRLGFRRLWYPFQWRVDDGEWQVVENDHYPAVDFMPVERWNKMVWTRFDRLDLEAGKHELAIRLTKAAAAEAEEPRLLWAADAFCFYKGNWRPNGKVQPGQHWRTERDLEAERHVFHLPEAPPAGARAEISLAGNWQLARFDEWGPVEDRLGPIPSVEDAPDLHWTSMQVPGDRNNLRPDLVDCHRWLYRTRVFVPESHAGRSFFMDLPMQNMIATVFVNGKRCGYSRAPYARMMVDLTGAVKPGEENEIIVGIKDGFYGISPDLTSDGTVRERWHSPLRERAGYLTNILDMPIALMWHSGILDRPLFVSAGSCYSADVFPHASVKNGTLKLGITLKNNTGSAAQVELVNEIVPWNGGDIEKRFAPVKVTVPAGGEKLIEAEETWQNPKLWWPDDPHLYKAVTIVKQDDEVRDVKTTRFGFREWDWSGTRFMLNGITWKLWQSHFHPHGPTAREHLEAMRQANVDMQRWRVGLGSLTRWGGLNYREWLEFCDENGIIVRTTSPWDGMFASYQLNPDQNPAIWDNAEHMIRHWAKGLRNHPSIGFWSLQNEIVLINLRNAKRGGPLMDRISDAVMEVDGTRPTMNDGAGATGNLPVTGIHYPTVKQVRHYPNEAYTWQESKKNRHGRRAILDMTLPVFVGEGYYTGGKSLGWFASVGGEQCFRGVSHCEEARMLFAQILCEGMRWQGIAAADFLTGPGLYQNSFKPIAVFCRQWDWTHASGATVERDLKVFNMTRHDESITARWELVAGEEVIASQERTFDLAAGTAREFSIAVEMPETDGRTECELRLSCTKDGEQVFEQIKDVSVINPNLAPVPAVEEAEVAVFDPAGIVQTHLEGRGIPYVEATPRDLPAESRVFIVGADALDQELSRRQIWRNLASQGKRLLVLDQEYPLLGEAVQGDFETTDFVGRIGFMEDREHPAFQGLRQKDFFCRSGADQVLYRQAYAKPTKGARSLVQCDEDLAYSALLESHVDEGLMLLCQAVAGSKLATDPVARLLFDNLLNYALDYERIVNPVAVVADGEDPKTELLREINLAFQRMDDPMEAINNGLIKVVVVDATETNLRKMAENVEQVHRFAENGGWVMLWGVTPDGIESFNELVGVDHLIRPYRLERSSLRRPRDPLAVGISERDVAMTTGRKHMRFTNTEIPSPNAFTHVVDYDDIAPFCRYPSPEYFKHFDDDPMNNGHHPLNMVNAMTARDGWQFTFYIHLFDDPPTEWTCELPRRETITGFRILPSDTYYRIGGIELGFGGDVTEKLELEPEEGSSMQRFDFGGHTTDELKIDISDIQERSDKRAVIGIQNMWIQVERSDEFFQKVKPLLTTGVLNRYPRGEGGIFLNQVKLMDAEPNPENADKKKSILKAVLTNLHAAFGTEVPVAVSIERRELTRFFPVVLMEQANLFLSREDNWPTDENDLSKLPLGKTRLDDVPYEIFDNELVPGDRHVVGLGSYGDFRGHKSTSLHLDRKADAVFLLHTFVQEQVWTPRGDAEPPIVFSYVVHYADDTAIEVPVRYGRGVANWLQRDPEDLPRAEVAWQADAVGGERTVLYHMLWANPRPDVAIRKLEMKATEAGDRLGMGLVAGVTLATR